MNIDLIVRYAMKRIEETGLLAGEILAHPVTFNRIAEQMCYYAGDSLNKVIFYDMLTVILYTIQESK